MSFGLGEFALGGFSDSISGSVADPYFTFVSDPSRPREFLLRGLPLDSGATVNVDLSTNGYHSLPTDTPYQPFPAGVGSPYNFNVSLPLPDLWGGSSVGVGSLGVANGDGKHDAAAMHDWISRPSDVYIGPPYGSLDDFTRIFAGSAAGVQWTLDDWSLLHRDMRYRLQKRLQPHRYMGTSSALKFAGTGYVDYGDILDQGATDSFTAEILFRISTISSSLLVSKKTAGPAANAGIRLNLTTSGGAGITFGISDGTTQIATITQIPQYIDGKWHRATLRVNRATQVLDGLIDGEVVFTTSIATIGSLANAAALRVGAWGDGTQGYTDTIDDFRFWSYARTDAEIQATMHRELSAGEAAVAELYSKFNENTGTSALDSSGHSRTGTITNGTWVGSLEGNASLAGQVKPLLLGQVRQRVPVLVDPIRFVYQIHDGPVQAIDGVQIDGDDYTVNADVADIYQSTPGVGQFNTCLAKGLFRLNAAPSGSMMTFDARGDNASPLGYVNTIAGCLRKVFVWGGLVDPDELDTGAFTALGILVPHVVGYYFNSELNADEAADVIAVGGNCWWSPTRTGKATCGQIIDPSLATATVELTGGSLTEDGQFVRTPFRSKVGTVVVEYQQFSPLSSFAAALSLEERDDRAKDYRRAVAQDAAATADSGILVVRTEFDTAAAAQVEADRLLAFFKRELDLYTVSIQSGTLAYFIGTVMRITLPRYNLATGKNFAVVGVTEDMGRYGTPDNLTVMLVG